MHGREDSWQGMEIPRRNGRPPAPGSLGKANVPHADGTRDQERRARRSLVPRRVRDGGRKRACAQSHARALRGRGPRDPGAPGPAGDDAIDAGANIGLFSVYLASLVGSHGRVLAIEPSPAILPSLRRNLERNGASNVIVHQGLVADEAGEREFHSVNASPEYSSMGAIVHPHAPRDVSTLRVSGTTLDILVDRHGLEPCFVKIDVEGAEGLVLEGARKTIQRFRPAILSEIDDRLLGTLGYTSSRVWRALEESRYRVLDLCRWNRVRQR